jgi:hypothetical protein
MYISSEQILGLFSVFRPNGFSLRDINVASWTIEKKLNMIISNSYIGDTIERNKELYDFKDDLIIPKKEPSVYKEKFCKGVDEKLMKGLEIAFKEI